MKETYQFPYVDIRSGLTAIAGAGNIVKDMMMLMSGDLVETIDRYSLISDTTNGTVILTTQGSTEEHDYAFLDIVFHGGTKVAFEVRHAETEVLLAQAEFSKALIDSGNCHPFDEMVGMMDPFNWRNCHEDVRIAVRSYEMAYRSLKLIDARFDPKNLTEVIEVDTMDYYCKN